MDLAITKMVIDYNNNKIIIEYIRDGKSGSLILGFIDYACTTGFNIHTLVEQHFERSKEMDLVITKMVIDYNDNKIIIEYIRDGKSSGLILSFTDYACTTGFNIHILVEQHFKRIMKTIREVKKDG